MQTMQQDWTKPRRASPVMLLTGIIEAIKESVGYLFIALVASVFRNSETARTDSIWEAIPWYLVGFLIAFLTIKGHKLIAWFFTRFWLEADKVVLTSGLWIKQRVELPIAQIQTMQQEQTLLHRLTGTCALRMDTAGSDQAEFHLDAVALNDARDLQLYIRSLQPAMQAQAAKVTMAMEQPATAFILSLQPMDFLKLCISENHLKSLLLTIFFIGAKVVDVFQQLDIDSDAVVPTHTGNISWGLSVLLPWFAVAILLAIGVSVAQVLLRYYGFQLRQSGSVYDMAWGLFTRQKKLMPLQKITYITWTANWLRGKMELYLLRLHSLAESVTEPNLQVQLPVTNRRMLQQITQSYVPVMPRDATSGYHRIHKVIIYRRLLLIGLPVALAAGLLLAYWKGGWYTGLPIIWLLYYLVSQYFFQRNYKVWISADGLQIEKGIWGRKHLVIKAEHMVHIAIRTSPWQRRHGYASLDLYLPGNVWTIPYLTGTQAAYWADYFTLKMEA